MSAGRAQASVLKQGAKLRGRELAQAGRLYLGVPDLRNLLERTGGVFHQVGIDRVELNAHGRRLICPRVARYGCGGKRTRSEWEEMASREGHMSPCMRTRS